MKKISFVPLLVLVVLGGVLCAWFYIKHGAAAAADIYSTTWNEEKTCYINSYVPKYADFGVAGKFVKLFSSEAFFKVYNVKGELLKSSEWLLWQNEFTTDERSQWVNGHAIYPTSTGYEGWNILECSPSDGN